MAKLQLLAPTLKKEINNLPDIVTFAEILKGSGENQNIHINCLFRIQ